ncbi:MAG: glutamyl-tRNA reductase [Deltaproteobacteria bacterium]|nr:glutamyl-tRNA reductase [Deltaproteobacteria bacterium]
MDIVLIGISHKTAPVELRERLAFSDKVINNSLNKLKLLPGIMESMILSTCNRVELLAVVEEKERGKSSLLDFLSYDRDVLKEEFLSLLYELYGKKAVYHIFKVASSLDSMVIGEPQILGQLKEAYEVATRNGSSGLLLHKLMHRAFFTAKRVRSETKIGNNAVSISYAAVELAKKIFEDLSKRKVLVVGTGEMAELAVKHLISHNIGKIVVTSRSIERAKEFASIFGGNPISFDGLVEQLEEVDIVISSTASPRFIITYNMIKPIMKKRKNRPIFMIDIAVPRDIEPEVNRIANIFLYDIDDLQQIVEDNLKNRESEAKKAEIIIKEEVEKFFKWLENLNVIPTIKSLKEKWEDIRLKELNKTFSKLKDLSEKERASIDAMTKGIINKIFHEPATRLRRAELSANSTLYIEVIRELFGLDDINKD